MGHTCGEEVRAKQRQRPDKRRSGEEQTGLSAVSGWVGEMSAHEVEYGCSLQIESGSVRERRRNEGHHLAALYSLGIQGYNGEHEGQKSGHACKGVNLSVRISKSVNVSRGER